MFPIYIILTILIIDQGRSWIVNKVRECGIALEQKLRATNRLRMHGIFYLATTYKFTAKNRTDEDCCRFQYSSASSNSPSGRDAQRN
jgi:hypothetical protein